MDSKEMHCDVCHQVIEKPARHYLNMQFLCDDCYIDRVHPKTLKPNYNYDSAGFFRRLKTAYSRIRQEID